MKQVLKKLLLIVFFMVILNISVYEEDPNIKVSINNNKSYYGCTSIYSEWQDACSAFEFN